MKFIRLVPIALLAAACLASCSTNAAQPAPSPSADTAVAGPTTPVTPPGYTYLSAAGYSSSKSVSALKVGETQFTAFGESEVPSEATVAWDGNRHWCVEASMRTWPTPGIMVGDLTQVNAAITRTGPSSYVLVTAPGSTPAATGWYQKVAKCSLKLTVRDDPASGRILHLIQDLPRGGSGFIPRSLVTPYTNGTGDYCGDTAVPNHFSGSVRVTRNDSGTVGVHASIHDFGYLAELSPGKDPCTKVVFTG